eukprot:Clim_evm9s164 gene=Clim_evmTU9s164
MARARANLEIWKFGLYVFMPVATFYYFNLPEFYKDYVEPHQDRIWIPDEKPQEERPPRSLKENQARLQELLKKK